MRHILCKVVALAFGISQPSFAQYSPPVFIGNWDYTSGSVQLMNDELVRESTVQATLNQQRQTRNQFQAQSRNVQSLSAQATASDLIFRMSPEARKRNIANFIEKGRAVDPAGADQMEQIFASTDVFATLESAIAPYGLRSNNVADAYTMYWITAWEAARGVRGQTETRARVQAVKKQVVQALTATPTFVSATPLQKQEFAEALMIQAALVQASVDRYATDRDMLKKVSAAVKTAALEMGLDLNKMALSERGFSPVR
jgi:hypothetical protein